MKPIALAIPTNWRRGLAVTAVLHGGLAVALATHIRTAEQIQAPAFSIDLAAMPVQTDAPSTATPAPPTPAAQPNPATNSGSLAESKDAVAVRHDDAKPDMASLRATQPVETPGKPQQAVAAPTVAPPAPPAAAAPASQVAARAAAPSSEAVSDPSAQARASWESQVLARLESGKRYPAASRFAREEGTVYVAFTVGQNGRAYGIRLVRSGGHRSLDEEVLSLLQRVKLPPPPASTAGRDPALTVPIEFSLDRRR